MYLSSRASLLIQSPGRSILDLIPQDDSYKANQRTERLVRLLRYQTLRLLIRVRRMVAMSLEICLVALIALVALFTLLIAAGALALLVGALYELVMGDQMFLD